MRGVVFSFPARCANFTAAAAADVTEDFGGGGGSGEGW